MHPAPLWHLQHLHATQHPFPAADYGFEYSDEEQDEQDVDIENQYYNSKGEPGSRRACPLVSCLCATLLCRDGARIWPANGDITAHFGVISGP